ncbi:MAG TPA: hypothetical protein VHE35_20365 [Kofleriaceae bacterium]|nr:hypothetical protein [Kofleriaceae bacterium]
MHGHLARMLGSTIGLGALAVAFASLAHADAKRDQAAVTALESAYAASAKLSGAARTTQACADEAAIVKAANALPETAPGGSALDRVSWEGFRDPLISQLGNFAAVCARPDRTLKPITGGTKTADQIVAMIDASVRAAVDAGKPRDVPADLKKIGATISATHANASACKQKKALAKLAGTLATPANADPARWKAAGDALASALADLGTAACSSPRGADEDISAAVAAAHDAHLQLVLAITPR